MTRRGQRGFTLIELMVALLVSSLLVGMILAIFSRMSLAYRGQQQIAGVQQVLAAARATIELDAKQAGLGMSQGFKSVPTGAVLQSPVKVTDSATGPDQIAFFYADTSTQGVVTGGTLPTLTLDAVAGFSPSTLVVLSTASTMASPGHATDPYVASYQACIVKIAAGGIAGNTVTFDAAAPWGPSTAAGCTVSTGTTMMYPLVAHGYKIDTSATTRGALQLSSNGGLLGASDTWNDLAYGFSDIQTAVRLEDNGVNGDVDGDGDALRNWYSGANQVTATSLPITPANSLVIGMSISLVAHTDRDIEGIATASTPALTGAIVNNNNLGNRPSTVLPTARPWPDPLLPGLAVYRYTTFTIDFRNLGVGQ